MRIQQKIEQRIKKDFSPSKLIVVNNSEKHKGHAGDNGSGESHFSLTIVSDAFKDLGRLQRQRAIHDSLREVMPMIHALSIQAQTPEEYSKT